MKKIETFFTEKEEISPGGLAAIGLKVDNKIVTYCIGSGDNFREAKACTLKNVRIVLQSVKMMKPKKEMKK